MYGKSRRPSMMWTRPRVTRSLAGRPAMSAPSNVTSPVIRPPARGSTPEMAISSVLLPAALAPTTATICPEPTANDTSQRTRTSPYQALRPTASSKQVLLAEIGLDDAGMASDRRRRTLGDLLAVVEDEDARRDLHDNSHDVLDHQQREAPGAEAAQELDHALDLGGIEAGEHLVEEKEPRGGRQRPRDLEPLAQLDRERPGKHVGERRHAGRLEHAVGGRPRVPGPTVAGEGAHHHVLAHRHAAERLDELEGAAEAEMAAALGREVGHRPVLEADLASIGPEETAHEREERGLPGAVGADHPHDLPFLDAEADVAHGGEAAEPLGDPAHVQEGHSHAAGAARRRVSQPRASTTRPCRA